MLFRRPDGRAVYISPITSRTPSPFLDCLSERQRAILSLHHLGMTNAQIARAMSIHRSTVGRIYLQAIRVCNKRLALNNPPDTA